ncbi:MAG: DUF2029 domain-containing protein [Deltaproteobacteria bacterium]|nr:DUF2029 domain-containing protein [Deltaproteobacteria bacterium]MBN2673803.1 DUF2029 domain-containing protein [Deltaproteobacteria bacterium]
MYSHLSNCSSDNAASNRNSTKKTASPGLIGALIFFCAIALFHGQTFKRLYNSGQHDLRAYLACAHDMIDGRPIYKTYHRVIPEDPILNDHVPPFVYPPLLGALLIPATVVAYDDFKHVWFFLNFFFLLHGIFLAVSILPFASNRSIAFLLVGGVMLGSDMFHWLLHAAQVDAFTIWLSTLSLWFFEKKKWMAGAVFICLAAWIKITPGIFLVYFLTRGTRRFAIYAAAIGIGLGLIQFAAFPNDFLYFFHKTLFEKMPTPSRAPTMQSLWALSEMFLVPGNGINILNAPNLVQPLLLILKAVVALFAIAVVLRKRVDVTGRFLEFAVCSCVAVLITDMSWMMRFVWNFIPIIAILHVISGATKRWEKSLLIPFGIFLILLNLEVVWKGALGELQGWKAVFAAGPGLCALFSVILLGTLCMIRSQWSAPMQWLIGINRLFRESSWRGLLRNQYRGRCGK